MDSRVEREDAHRTPGRLGGASSVIGVSAATFNIVHGCRFFATPHGYARGSSDGRGRSSSVKKKVSSLATICLRTDPDRRGRPG